VQGRGGSLWPHLMKRFLLAALCGVAAWTITPASFSIADAAEPGCPANAKKANLNFTLKDLDGKSIKLSDYQGKVLLGSII
jgi:cytochrome oxidase Cu insertion factor (SCO1/SenC/PrrC family)